MAFALSHAKKHDLRRVIVVIPYLSIIEQNAKEYRDALGEELVLEHHSAVELSQGSRRTDDSDLKEPTDASDMEKAMENWDMPVIVTTSVQFIETLFAASPGQARKLHNIPRSVVIFDEVQTLPSHLLEPTLNVLRELKDRWGVSILFCSATQPAFKKSASLKNGFEPDEMTPIVPEPENVFKKLRRVDYCIEPKENPLNWRMVAERMTSHQQVLCILNIRRQAFELWDTLRRLLHEKGFVKEEEEALFHLSSAMCPAHRLDLLGLSKNPAPNNIMERLRNGKPCWVASTQLIEAGVDIDFPVVFRAMGPLDSIVQAAGRCNREGLLQDEQGNLCRGKVVIFCPSDGGLPPGIYSKGTSITPAYLEPERIAEDPAIFSQYFHELYQITPTDFNQRGQHTIQEDRAEFRFRKVAEHARVIKKGETVSVIVPYGKGKAMIDQIRRTKDFDFKTLRRLQRYMVNVRKQEPYSDFAKLNAIGAITPLLPDRLEIPVIGDWCYKTDPAPWGGYRKSTNGGLYPMNPANLITIRVWGDYACFTRPEMKVERVSYPICTPSAARGILEAIYWEPQMYYVIDTITVIKKGRWFNFRRNEVTSVISLKEAQSWMAGRTPVKHISAGGGAPDAAQRNMLGLAGCGIPHYC